MKKLIKKITLAMAGLVLAFGLTLSPVLANAEETTETPEISTETVVGGEIPELEDNGAETEDNEAETTFEDFLTWSQEQADLYGYGNEYAAAMAAIKTAATKKQVTLSTIASFAFAAVVLALIISGKIKDKKYKAAVLELSEKLDRLSKGANALIDGENALLDGEHKLADGAATTAKKTDEVKAEVHSLKRAFSLFVSAFLRFSDGIKLGDNKKTEVQTNCLNALKEVGEVEAHENNEK